MKHFWVEDDGKIKWEINLDRRSPQPIPKILFYSIAVLPPRPAPLLNFRQV
jgi:hypothetical protein